MMVSAISSTTDSTAFLTSSRVTGSMVMPLYQDVAQAVAARGPAWGHDGGGVVLLDDQWPDLDLDGQVGRVRRRVCRARRAAGRSRPAGSTSRRGAVASTRRMVFAAGFPQRTGDHPQVDQFDSIDAVTMAVGALVLGLETARRRRPAPQPRPPRRAECAARALSAVAQVDKPLEQHSIWRVPFAGQPRTCSTLEGVQSGKMIGGGVLVSCPRVACTSSCRGSAYSRPNALNRPGQGGTMTTLDARAGGQLRRRGPGRCHRTRPACSGADRARARWRRPGRRAPCSRRRSGGRRTAASSRSRPSGSATCSPSARSRPLRVDRQRCRRADASGSGSRAPGWRRSALAARCRARSRPGRARLRRCSGPTCSAAAGVDPYQAAAAGADLGDVQGRHAQHVTAAFEHPAPDA